MLIAGLQKLTLLDYPEKTACTVFTAGCNFRCPFCHNAALVTQKPDNLMTQESFFEFLSKRKGILDGVCITGGEPTMQEDIIPFMEKIKAMGFLLKLDTNGYKPNVLKEILMQGLVDYVAMDIKASFENYKKATDCKNLDLSRISESIKLLEESDIPHEFRTTVTKELHKKEDLTEILSLFCESTPYYLQQFENSGCLIDQNCHGYSDRQLEEIYSFLASEHKNVFLRGI